MRQENYKEKYEELKSVIDLRMQFTSMVSHELRSSLSVIQESVNVVLDGLVGGLNKEQKEFLQSARESIDRLARLINNVLDFQKIQAGKVSFDMKPNNINDIVCGVHKDLAFAAEKKGIYFNLELDKNIPEIILDRDKITQVIINLVNNAVKFTEHGGITVSTFKEDNVVHVVTADTGPGVKKDDLDKLFHNFQQLDVPKDKSSSGTGLGLAISKEIILLHGGRIWAESLPGRGTMFHFVLPIKERRKNTLL